MSSDNKCIFCKVISKESPGEMLYEDEEITIFKDIKPAAEHHYLVVPREHIISINDLNLKEHKKLLDKMIEKGKEILQKQNADVEDTRMGFHCPPFNSVSHLHMHLISPASQMTFINDLIFRPKTWWFVTVDRLFQKLEEKDELVENKL